MSRFLLAFSPPILSCLKGLLSVLEWLLCGQQLFKLLFLWFLLEHLWSYFVLMLVICVELLRKLFRMEYFMVQLYWCRLLVPRIVSTFLVEGAHLARWKGHLALLLELGFSLHLLHMIYGICTYIFQSIRILLSVVKNFIHLAMLVINLMQIWWVSNHSMHKRTPILLRVRPRWLNLSLFLLSSPFFKQFGYLLFWQIGELLVILINVKFSYLGKVSVHHSSRLKLIF